MTNKKNLLVLFISLIIFFSTQSIYALKQDDLHEKMVDNILLIGKDGVEGKGASRSDTMIILTIDNLNKSLKLTSLARDIIVKIPNRGYEKLNHAYAYGGVDLLIKTINENLNLNLKDYAIVDFRSFIEIIDALGGVTIDVNEKEINHLNKVINTCYGLSEQKEGNIEYITNIGNQQLNGYQALAYARIRKMDTIYNRDERQRKILANVAQNLSNTSVTNYASIVKSLIKYVDVNISFSKIMKMALISHELASYDIKQLQFPSEKYREETKLEDNGMFVVKWDKDKNIEMLHKFIYGN